jgi:hypothetical protein
MPIGTQGGSARRDGVIDGILSYLSEVRISWMGKEENTDNAVLSPGWPTRHVGRVQRCYIGLQ